MKPEDLKPLEKKAEALIAGARQADPNPQFTKLINQVADYLENPDTNPVPQFLDNE